MLILGGASGHETVESITDTSGLFAGLTLTGSSPVTTRTIPPVTRKPPPQSNPLGDLAQVGGVG